MEITSSIEKNKALVPLGDSGTRLVYAPHPILPQINRQIIHTPFIPGENLLAYLSRLRLYFGSQPVVLAINNNTIIPRSDWSCVYLEPGDIITVRAQMHGGDGESNPLNVILSIVVLIYAPQFAASLGVSSTLVTVGGLLLVNAIAPHPDPVDPDTNDQSPNYSLSGGQNRARLNGPMSLVLGTHRVYPDLGAREFTENRGNDQYLYLVFHYGLSELNLSNHRIGDTPLSAYDDTGTEESGTDGVLTLFPGNVDSLAGDTLELAAGWTTRTSSVDATALKVDISGLLFRFGKRGLEQLRATIGIEYRLVGITPWSDFFGPRYCHHRQR